RLLCGSGQLLLANIRPTGVRVLPFGHDDQPSLAKKELRVADTATHLSSWPDHDRVSERSDDRFAEQELVLRDRRDLRLQIFYVFRRYESYCADVHRRSSPDVVRDWHLPRGIDGFARSTMLREPGGFCDV